MNDKTDATTTATPAATDSATSSPAAVTAAPASAEPAAPAAPAAPEAPAQTKTESTQAPSLLAGADAAKREGAEQAAPPPATTEPPPGDAEQKPEPTKGEGEQKTEAKPEGKVKDGDAAAAEKKDATADAPPAPPVYDAYEVPDGIKLDTERVTAFNALLGEAELAGKADHGAMQALGQKLVAFHAEEMQRVQEAVTKQITDNWTKIQEQRISEFRADPEIGGVREQTTLGNAKYVIEQSGLTPEEQAELLSVWDAGGISNHRLTVKLLNRIHDRFAPPAPVTPNPPITKPAGTGGRGWYDT